MTKLHFDPNGNLMPFSKITTDLATFEKVFVTDFENSTTRKTLFDNYLRYLDAFSKEITPNFTQWINGSFVTQKENPNDIDFVSFISSELYEEKINIIDNFLSFSLEEQKLDAFVLAFFPKDHERYLSYTIMNLEKWDSRFSYTRENDSKIIFPKGYIEINY